jgi:hypothetical protein
VKVALVLPAGTWTDAGTLAIDEWLLLRVTARPPLGAAPVKVTVPWEMIPPNTVVGVMVNELKTGGVTVSVAIFWFSPSSAVMVAIVEAATG